MMESNNNIYSRYIIGITVKTRVVYITTTLIGPGAVVLSFSM